MVPSCIKGINFHLYYLLCDRTFSFEDLLGDRLEAADDAQLQVQACLCYICAGNVEKLVSCWTRAQEGHCPLSLQVGLHSDSCSVSCPSVPVLRSTIKECKEFVRFSVSTLLCCST